MKRGYSIAFLIFLVILAAPLASAHQPRLVYEKESDIARPFIVENPEISQAFYGELKGKPDYYLISSSKDLNLYLGILSPAVEDARKDFSFDINNITISGVGFNWTLFYEEFAGDNYWKGPEYEREVRAGDYLIKVYNEGNTGKYSLAVGKIESFPPGEALKTFIVLPKLKIFFEKSPFTAYLNILGLFLLGILVILAIIIIALILIIKKLRKNKK